MELNKAFDNFKIDSQGIDNGYRWITFTTPAGREVKMQEGWGEQIFEQREDVKTTFEAAKLVKYIKDTDGKVYDGKELSDQAIYEIIRKYPAWELQSFVTAYLWFNKEVAFPEDYSFRPSDIKSKGT